MYYHKYIKYKKKYFDKQNKINESLVKIKEELEQINNRQIEHPASINIELDNKIAKLNEMIERINEN
jgi:hypothetical protein